MKQQTTINRSSLASLAIRVGALFAALVICLSAAQQADAANLPVTTTADTGAGSLRQAVLDANATAANDTIVIEIESCGATVCTITLASEIVIANNGSLTISGTGANRLIIDGGAGTNNIFFVNSNTIFDLSGATLTGGNGAGGAIFVNGGSNHRIENCAVSANSATNFGGILAQGGLTVVNSTLTGNNAPNNVGGAIAHFGTPLTLLKTTVTDNTALFGGISIQGDFTFGNNIITGNSGGNRPEIYFAAGTATSTGYNLVGDQTGDSANTENSIAYQSTDIRASR